MVEGPIDINRSRKDQERTEAVRDALQTVFVRILDNQNKINMRVEDLAKDAADLAVEINNLIAEIYERFPEFEPNLEIEEDDFT